MFGLMVLLAMVLYLLIAIAVVKFSIRYARQHGRNVKRWGWSAALVMYLIPFWDWLPTVITHQYYCATESGFWVYKTLDQWQRENPGVMEGLVANKGAPSTRDGNNTNFTDIYFLNQRFNWIVAYHDAISVRLLPIRKIEQAVIDVKTHNVLARYVDFSVGYGNIMVRNDDGLRGFKFWLAKKHCINGGSNQDALRNFRNNFIGAEK